MGNTKYFREFDLQIFGDQYCLIQEYELRRRLKEDNNIFLKNNYHIYMITSRPKLVFKINSLKILNNYVKGSLIMKINSKEEIIKFKYVTNVCKSDMKIMCSPPFRVIKFLNSKTGTENTYDATIFYLEHCKRHIKDRGLEILYIGQAYGKDGKRTAADRLLKHETLQEIYCECNTRYPDSEIWLLLWSFGKKYYLSADGTSEIFHISEDEDEKHFNEIISTEIKEAKMISFIEAALINYFKPVHNTIYKNGKFPSIDYKACIEYYKKDFSCVLVEVDTTNLGIPLCSNQIESGYVHIIDSKTHADENRRSFFDAFLNMIGKKR